MTPISNRSLVQYRLLRSPTFHIFRTRNAQLFRKTPPPGRDVSWQGERGHKPWTCDGLVGGACGTGIEDEGAVSGDEDHLRGEVLSEV